MKKYILSGLLVVFIINACLFESDFNDIYSIVLSETGVYVFSNAEPDYGPRPARTVIVSNTGDRATGSLKIELSSGDTNAFILSQQTIKGIGVGRSASFTVMPKTGLDSKMYTATVTISGGKGIAAGFDVVFQVNGLEVLDGDVTIQLPIGINKDEVPLGTELTASYDGNENVLFQWNKDGASIQGKTDYLYTPEEPGIYTVTVSLEGYSSKTSDSVTVVLSILVVELDIIMEDDDFGIDDVGKAVFESQLPVVLSSSNTSETLSLEGKGLSNIDWYLGNILLISNSETYTLEKAMFNSGIYKLTIIFTKDDNCWSGDFTFTVLQD